MRAFKYILTIALISVSVTVFSQETKVVKNRKKILEKQEQEKEKAQEKSIEEGKERPNPGCARICLICAFCHVFTAAARH